jgi:O-antigen ligase
VRDAHSLYLETLAEIGPLGLLLVLAVLGMPLVAARRSRRGLATATLPAAYVAFLLHAGIDWDWEMPIVMLAGLACAAALLLASRNRELAPVPAPASPSLPPPQPRLCSR